MPSRFLAHGEQVSGCAFFFSVCTHLHPCLEKCTYDRQNGCIRKSHRCITKSDAPTQCTHDAPICTYGAHRINSAILRNEKYKGDALLQKYYTPDFLTKKQVHNNGEVPQYYVEGSHEAIIEPAIFDRVQDIIRERSQKKGYSGMTIFSSRIKCGCCGAWYGTRIGHSTDKYRRVVWQCNAKFKDKTRCQTPHLTEDEVKEAFLHMVNSIITDRDGILMELRMVRDTLSGTAELETEQARLAEQMNADADAVQSLISENARVPQDQAEYAVRYEALASRFEETKAKYEKVTAEIAAKGSASGNWSGSSSRWRSCPAW